MLFQWDLGRDSPDKVEELFWSNTRPREDDPLHDAANSLFRGTVEAVEEIDRRIRRSAEHWRLERMAIVDRNILRLGTYELLYHPETPPPAVISNDSGSVTRTPTRSASRAMASASGCSLRFSTLAANCTS